MEFTVVLFIVLVRLIVTTSSIDLDEFRGYSYDVDITNLPLRYEDAALQQGVVLASTHGQLYQCLYEVDDKDDVGSVGEAETNASALLEHMKDNECLQNSFGWWTYEFCYGKQVRQFHVNKVTLDQESVSTLGHYSYDFDWDAADVKRSNEFVNHYHSQQYVNGSLCDLTSKMRSVLVRFTCSVDGMQAEQIVGVDEPSTCEYIMHISTPKICKLQHIKTHPTQKNVPIKCHPLLHSDDYDEYMHVLQTKKESESVEQSKGTSLEDTLHGWEKWLSTTKAASLIIVGISSTSKINFASKTGHEESITGEETEQSADADETRESVEVQIVNSVEELAKVIEHLQTDATVEVELSSPHRFADSLLNDDVESVGTSEHLDGQSGEKMTSVTSDDVSGPESATSNSAVVVEEKEQEQARGKDAVHFDSSSDDRVTTESSQEEAQSSSVQSAVDELLHEIDEELHEQHDASPQRPDQEINRDTEAPTSSSLDGGKNIETLTGDEESQLDQDFAHSSPRVSTAGKLMTIGEETTADTDESADSADTAEELREQLLRRAKLLKKRIEEAEKEANSNGRPLRKLEVKVLNADYYDHEGRPRSTKSEKRVMAIFQHNDNEIETYTRQLKQQDNYNFRWKKNGKQKGRNADEL